ncbi:phosphoribosyltransferase family protein [Succinivibrio dextrinosolvens]|uniref:phosphoribosyltransferase family protein n=1 Tax=Succinivibrio dextrinosolvens TaxID=83771 RepID=UPI00192507F9|nr:phosphoribosyltransferase family protein [Succinivibrio dextrinosolvens]
MNFKTINDLNSIIYKNLHKIPKDVDLVVGIPRSGMLPATIISLFLNLPLCDLDSLLNNEIYKSGSTKIKKEWIKSVSQARKILIVEDSSCSGSSLEQFYERTKDYEFKDRFVLLTVYVTKNTRSLTDLWFEIVPIPRLFEWNFMHHSSIGRVCFDMDGVLCVDPSEEENDDGELYLKFIKNAPLKLVPTFKIGYIITSRLEKYRTETEKWLRDNNIKYDELIMMPYVTKEERLKSDSHGVFKGTHYKKLKSTYLFVESNARQAYEIAKISGKAVFCTENQIVYEENFLLNHKENIKSSFLSFIKRILPKWLKKYIKSFFIKIKLN